MRPTFFTSAEQWRRWLERRHATATELLVGFFKTSSGKRGITYAEALDEALCFGWIDGRRTGLDALRYTIRFSPRRPSSIWSLINLKHVQRLKKAGRMHPAGLAAFERRDLRKSGIYSYESRPKALDPAARKVFRANPKAWAFYQAQAPWYRRTTAFWVMSAKQEKTRARRLQLLIDLSAQGQKPGVLAKKPSAKGAGSRL